MKRYKLQIVCFFALACVIGFCLPMPSYAQFTAEQEAKINAAADSAARVAANLPLHEKKIAWFILERINRMIKEQAKLHPNPEQKYSIKGFPVDKAARVLVNVALLRGSAKMDTNAVVEKIRDWGGAVKTVSNPQSDYPIEIYCWLPYDTVKAIAKLPKVANISGIGVWTTYTGSETTIGDSQLLADQARAYFNVNGSSIKVGVVSNGIQHASNSQATGDLPSSLQTTNGGTPGDEGTAMLEIVYDLAPGASLAFGGIGPNDGPNDMATRIFDLYQNIGCKIVVDDIGWLTGVPYFSESNLMQQIQARISSNDKTYVSAAGNLGESCWDGNSFVDADGWNRFWLQGSTYIIQNSVVVGPNATLRIYLQWGNLWGASGDNYDLYLYDINGSSVAVANTVQDGNDNPEEMISFTNGGVQATYFIRIKKMYTGTDRELKLVVDQSFKLGYTYPNYAGDTMPVRQIFGHPASLGAISVVAYSSDAPNALASYSSRGKTNLYVGPTLVKEERTTPTVVATAKVDTKVGKGGYFSQPFEGTSAAAPHVAGIAALYFSKYPTDSHAAFYNSLTSYATTLGSIGTGGVHNTQSGYGKANAFNTLAKGNFVPVTVSQVDEQSQAFGLVGVYEGTSFANYSVPKIFSWVKNSTQTLRSDQNFKAGTAQKYHDWNQLSDVVNHHPFTIDGITTNLTAHFNTANNATIQTQLLEGGSPGGSVEFKDPWLIDDTSDPKGPRNRGLNAVWTTQASPFTPSTGSSYKGVFSNQDPSTSSNYYRVRVLETQTMGGFTSYFQNWVTSGANITQPGNLVSGYYESPVVFQSAGATVTAKYKAHLGSGSTTATAYNNQRKVVWDGTNYHLVYESLGEIWYTTSTGADNAWIKEVRVSDGNGGNKYPSIDMMNGIVVVVWQQEFPNTGKICMRRKTAGGWQAQQEVASFFAGAGFTATPVVAVYSAPYYFIIWHDYDNNNLSIRSYNETNGSWGSETAIPSTNSNSLYPSLAADTYTKLHLAWAESGQIYYTKINHSGGGNYTFSPSKENVSSGTGYSNHVYPSITTDYSRRANVAWQAYSGPALETQIILHRRRELSDTWSSATSFDGNDEYHKPSITSYPNVPNNQKLRIAWQLIPTALKLAKYDGSSWTVLTESATGYNPNSSTNFTGSEAAKIVLRSGSASPYTITTTSQNLPKTTAARINHYRRGVMQLDKVELAFEVGDFTLHSGANKIPIELFVYNDTLAAGVTGEWNNMFRTEPVTFPANSELEFHNGFSVVNPRLIGNALPPGALVHFTLEAVEVSKNIPLAVLHEHIANRNDTLQFRGKRREPVPVALAGRQVYLRVAVHTQGPVAARPSLVEIYHDATDSLGLQRPELANGTSLPQTFKLHTNYPNPFNPETAIRFDLPEASEVVLVIFNALGERVKVLFHGQRAAGSYAEIWDGRNERGEIVASGVYIAKMQAGDFSATQKMLLLR